jgi:tetratricopeptide (TPR) repeat protein
LRTMGQVDRALADCTQAVTLNPRSSAAYLCRAEGYLNTGAPQQAIQEINRANVVAQSPLQTEKLTVPIQQVLENRSREEQAAVQAQAAPVAAPAQVPPPSLPPPSAPPPSIPEPVKQVATAKPSAKSPVEAIRYEQTARARVAKWKLDEALHALDRAIELDPQLTTAYNARGYVNMLLRRFEAAIGDFSEAIRLNPAYKNAYVNRGAARKLAGDTAGSAADFHKAAALDRAPGARILGASLLRN